MNEWILSLAGGLLAAVAYVYGRADGQKKIKALEAKVISLGEELELLNRFTGESDGNPYRSAPKTWEPEVIDPSRPTRMARQEAEKAQEAARARYRTAKMVGTGKLYGLPDDPAQANVMRNRLVDEIAALEKRASDITLSFEVRDRYSYEALRLRKIARGEQA